MQGHTNIKPNILKLRNFREFWWCCNQNVAPNLANSVVCQTFNLTASSHMRDVWTLFFVQCVFQLVKHKNPLSHLVKEKRQLFSSIFTPLHHVDSSKLDVSIIIDESIVIDNNRSVLKLSRRRNSIKFRAQNRAKGVKFFQRFKACDAVPIFRLSVCPRIFYWIIDPLWARKSHHGHSLKRKKFDLFCARYM